MTEYERRKILVGLAGSLSLTGCQLTDPNENEIEDTPTEQKVNGTGSNNVSSKIPTTRSASGSTDKNRTSSTKTTVSTQIKTPNQTVTKTPTSVAKGTKTAEDCSYAPSEPPTISSIETPPNNGYIIQDLTQTVSHSLASGVNSPQIEFKAGIVNKRIVKNSPGMIKFTLINNGSRIQYIASGIDFPFGPMTAEKSSSDEDFLLWQDFDDMCGIAIDERGIGHTNVGVSQPLQPGETVSSWYQILPESTSHFPNHTVPPGPGNYTCSGWNIAWSENEHAKNKSKTSYAVDFSLGYID